MAGLRNLRVAFEAAQRLAGAAEGAQLALEHVALARRGQLLWARVLAAGVEHHGVVAPPLRVEARALLAVLVARGEPRWRIPAAR